MKQAWSELYQADVLNVIYYANYLEAYRSDRFSNFTKQPLNTGTISNQNGFWGYYGATPVSAPGQGSPGSGPGGMGAGGWIGIGAAVLVVLGVGGFLISRNKKTADERE